MSRARAIAALLLASVAAASHAQDAQPHVIPVALLGEATVSARSTDGPVLGFGGRVTLRLAALSVSGSLDAPGSASADPLRLDWLALVGLGAAQAATSGLTLSAAAVAGLQGFRLRDYVEGGWRTVAEPALGGRAGVEWRPDSGLGAALVLGASATVVYVAKGDDRLRGVDWGGVTALATVSAGVEFREPARVPHPSP